MYQAQSGAIRFAIAPYQNNPSPPRAGFFFAALHTPNLRLVIEPTPRRSGLAREGFPWLGIFAAKAAPNALRLSGLQGMGGLVFL